jgi:hypothetical protein
MPPKAIYSTNALSQPLQQASAAADGIIAHNLAR